MFYYNLWGFEDFSGDLGPIIDYVDFRGVIIKSTPREFPCLAPYYPPPQPSIPSYPKSAPPDPL